MHTRVIIPALYPLQGDSFAWAMQGFAQQKLAGGHTCEVMVGLDGGAGREAISPSRMGIPITVKSLPRMGAAAVRNVLAREAGCDMLIFANADTRPAPDMVQRHADTLWKLPAGSMVLGSAPWEKPPHPTVFDALLAETPMVFFYRQLAAGQWYDFRHAWTLNLSIRHSDFVAAGGFHEHLRPVYFEDIAFGLRLLGAERKGIYYEPAASVVHRHPTTLEDYLQREELLGLMSPVLARECPDAFAAIHGMRDAAALAAQYRQWVAMDHAMHRWIYKRFAAWTTQPESTLGSGESREHLLLTIYQMHIPLKRLAFRLGYLRGMELQDDARWQERKPAGLWRAIVT